MDENTAAPRNDGYRIVVGVDYTEACEAAVREALRLSNHRGDVALHVVHVLPRPVATALRAGAMGALGVDLQMAPERLKRYLLDLSERMPTTGAQEIHLHVRVGDPAQVIHDVAVDVDADLVVVGTHCRRGLARVAVGNVAEALLRSAHCPVLVARPRDFLGLNPAERIEPMCPECATVFRETRGSKRWCEHHTRPHVAFHPYASSEVFRVGRNTAGI